MRYDSTLLAVTNLKRSLDFYKEVLGLAVEADLGANVVLTGGLSLQTLESWAGFIRKPSEEIRFHHLAGELYFEEDDLDGFLQKLSGLPAVRLVHPVIEHSWGQRTVRFYDPDGHIIEVGENMRTVVQRFIAGGLTPEQTALRMDVPLSYVEERME